jgi:MinD-like ATPase involved in chromosome partitioning or flagellar assembly
VIICVTGGKGGPGATVLATNLAMAVAHTGRRCLLLDLDPFGGDIGAYLDPERLDPRRGLLPLLKLERADIAPQAVERESQEVAPGLMVLLGSLRPATEFLIGRAGDVLRSANRTADVVVADLGRSVPLSPALDGLGHAHRCLVATRPDLQGALAAEGALSLVGNRAPVRIVATKVRRGRVADVVELSEALGRPIDASVPELRVPVRLNQSRRLRRQLAHLISTLVAEGQGAEGTLAGLQEAVTS